MDILSKIVKHKEKEVAERKSLYPIKLLEQSIYFETPAISLKQYIKRADKSGVIAEIKRKSPSKGDINPYVSVERTSIGYMQAGASALSILTDNLFFGGSSGDLTTARKFNFCPILRKDFVIDEYQLVEAKSIGADAVLLIAAILDPAQLKSLCATAHALQLEVLLEVHDQDELILNLEAGADVVGVNNRNLKTFEVSTDLSKRLVQHIPNEFTKISESGIDTPSAAADLRAGGYDGFLIGELFMRSARPEHAAMEFVKELNRLEKKTKVHAIL
ncbi:MAG: indole-3-glycerol phosphate synthase TrpC [Cyclobacteriaceae bacterium]